MTSWILPDFPDKASSKSNKSCASSLTFQSSAAINDAIAAYQPKNVEDLVVNKSKLNELRKILCAQDSRGYNNIVLLTGPSGSGKSVSVKLTAEQLGFSVVEWSNQLSFRFNNANTFYNQQEVSMVNQCNDFFDFLSTAEKGCSLNLNAADLTHSNKLILVEELPFGLNRNVDRLWKLLAHLKRRGLRFPLVFVISDDEGSSLSSSSLKCLFPDHVVNELNVMKLNFNAATNKAVIAALRRILTHCQVPKSAIAEDILLAIAQKCRGDIRAAHASLQYRFSAQPGTQSSADKGHDQHFGLFRSLGKILYSKRHDLPQQAAAAELKQNDKAAAAAFSLPSLSFDPEDVLESCGVQPDTAAAYLHENWLRLMETCSDQSMDAVSTASLDVSLADLFSHVDSRLYEHRRNTSAYASSIVARSLAYYGYFCRQQQTTSKFFQICKPLSIGGLENEDILRASKSQSTQYCAGSSKSFILDYLAYSSIFMQNDNNLKNICCFKLKKRSYFQDAGDRRLLHAIIPDQDNVDSNDSDVLAIEQFDDAD